MKELFDLVEAAAWGTVLVFFSIVGIAGLFLIFQLLGGVR